MYTVLKRDGRIINFDIQKIANAITSVHGILVQARILEWVAILFSRESSQPRD